jgi:argininosuccinate lyase
VTVTELADVLARDHGLPFRTAHAVAVAVVRRAGDRPSAQLAGIVAAAAAEVAGAEIRLSDEAVRGALSPERFVEVRRTRGGPAPDVVDAALADAEAAIAGDRAAVNSLRDRLADADARLSQAARAL